MPEDFLVKQLQAFQSEITPVLKNVNDWRREQKNLQQQVDTIDMKLNDRVGGYSPSSKGLETYLKENESVQRLLRDKKGSAIIRFEGEASRLFDRKSVITVATSGSIGTDTGNPVGVSTSGVMPIDRSPGITPDARYALRLRGVLYARPTTAAVIDFRESLDADGDRFSGAGRFGQA